MNTGFIANRPRLAPPVAFSAADLPAFPPLEIGPSHLQQPPVFADASLEITYLDDSYSFAVIYKPRWTKQTLEVAMRQARVAGVGLPMVVLPYLDDEKLDALAAEQVSGLDLCGNGVVIVPGRWFLRYTGRQNRFKVEQVLRDAYRGKASLVGRVLLDKPRFRTVQDLVNAIRYRGGEVSQPLVSQALRLLREDLVVVDENEDKIVLLQPERLLDNLAQAWRPERARLLWQGRVRLPTVDLLPRVFENARAAGERVVLTGLGSVTRYANMGMEDVVYVYANRAEPLLVGLPAEETARFANLEVRYPPDESAYFDPADSENGVLRASEVQTYLEIARGDARLQESARTLRARIISRT
jgi:DNA-binding transcriptional ArsR family regulator